MQVIAETEEAIAQAVTKLKAIRELYERGAPELHAEINRLRQRQDQLEHERAARRAMKRAR